MASKQPDRTRLQDPTKGEPKPPFQQQQPEPYPGYEGQMQPKADHGEQSYKGSGKLVGRAALITGADSGIGRAVAIAYAREGADVLISYLSEDKDAQETAHWVQEAGRKAILMPGDISDEQHCHALVDRAVAEFGRLDIIVNNAAYQKTYEDLRHIPADELEHTFRTNIFAMFWICQAALPHLKPGSAIINTTSIQAFDPSANLLPYACTKGAIAEFTKALAKMLGKQGIRVNGVAPGPIWTPLIPSTMPEEKFKTFGQDTVLGRPGQPAELAPVYVLLAAPEASYITGEIYGVTGGRMPV